MFIINIILSENLIFMKKLHIVNTFLSKISLNPSRGFFIAIFYFLFFLPAASGLSQDKVTVQSSLEAFGKADYEKAFSEFSDLLASFPKDPVYKYYSGVCLVKLERDPAKAESLLSEALKGSTMKSVPSDVIFYLGRAQQMSGRFDDAEKTFRRFEREAGKKYSKQMNTKEYIAQCNAGQGMLFPSGRLAQSEEKKPDSVSEKVISVPSKEPVYLADADDRALSNIIDRQYEADILEKSGKASSGSTQMNKSDVPKPVVASGSSSKNNPANSNKETAVQNSTAVSPSIQSPGTQPVPESTVSKISGSDQDGLANGVYSIFSIVESTQAKDVRIDPAIPEGSVYRIQLAVFKNPVSPSYFKGLTPIEGFKSAATGSTTYYAGIFRRAEDARKALSAVRKNGFKDSFVVAMMNGKTISSERAAIYEKEWGNKPLYVFEKEQSGERLDTVPPTLHFRVEVVRSLKPLTTADIESLRKLAGNRGLDIVQLNNGNISYLIGNFITFESAEDYADLLQRNGYRDASVVAWLGKKEIDLETAKQLFNSLQ